MGFFRHHREVRSRVVPMVTVDVMHELVGAEVSANVCFDNQAMLHDVPLRVRKRVFWNANSPVAASAPIGDAPLEVGVSRPAHVHAAPLCVAVGRTEPLVTVPRARRRSSAFNALPRGRLTPTRSLVTGTGAVPRRLLAPSLRVEDGRASRTSDGGVRVSHVAIVPLNEDYCRIAVERLRQGVLL